MYFMLHMMINKLLLTGKTTILLLLLLFIIDSGTDQIREKYLASLNTLKLVISFGT
jgi:hypothetical protein